MREWEIPKIHATMARKCASPDPGRMKRHGTNNYNTLDSNSPSRSYRRKSPRHQDTPIEEAVE